MNKKSSSSGSFLSVQIIVLAATVWAVFALLFFLLFSVPLPGQERPEWYSITTYVLENTAFLAAGLLCFRNWRSPQIVSGRTVWLAIGLGMFSYFIANLFLAYWEIGLGNSPAVSPGDLFFILTYLFLGWGMLLAVLSRQLNLGPVQWLIVVGIAAAGIAIALTVSDPFSSEEDAPVAPPAVEQSAPARSPAASPGKSAPAPKPAIAPAPAASAEPAVPEQHDAPQWAIALEDFLNPLAGVVAWLYIIGDIILVVMATMLLLAFWGGRFSTSWRFIAAASFSYYVSDMWFNYAVNYIPNYQTGALPEVFWIFSGVLFAIGAALEYDLSTRSRRSGRRRGGT